MSIQLLGFSDSELAKTRVEFLRAYASSVLENRALDPTMAAVAEAGALAEVAQTLWFLDPEEASRQLGYSAESYARAQLPYGYFLLSFAGRPGRGLDALRDSAPRSMLKAMFGEVHESSEQTRIGMTAAHHPVQQMYLILAYLAHRESTLELADALHELLTRMEGHAAIPIGPQSAPMHLYLEIAWTALRMHTAASAEIDDDASSVAILGDLSTRYHAALSSARRNRYLWDRMSSPVEMIDLDLVGLAAILFGAMGLDAMERTVGKAKHLMPDLAGVPMEWAQQILREREL